MRVGGEAPEEVADAMAAFASRGAHHLIVGLEQPRDVRALEQLARAVERYGDAGAAPGWPGEAHPVSVYRSASIARAALAAGAPVMPPPGWLPEPAR